MSSKTKAIVSLYIHYDEIVKTHSQKSTILLLGCLTLGAVLRGWYAYGLPLNGDEVGVGVLQASGQATVYSERIPRDLISLANIQKFIQYNPEFSSREVFNSLRYAGMHPPFYYLLIHYVLQFLGNNDLVLRAISILASLGAIVALYYLGTWLCSELVGLYAAGLLALSSYGVLYAVLVRPYPVAMLLSLSSTALAVHMAQNGELRLKNWRFVLYLMLATVGVYTVYEYVFVLLFQAAFLMISCRDKRAVLNLSAGMALVGIGYIPWVPFLYTHLVDIGTHQYYFHQAFDSTQLLKTLFVVNFWPLFVSWNTQSIIIAVGFATCLLFGMRVFWRGKVTAPFCIAFITYLFVYIMAEGILHMSTLAVPKFLFFLIPTLYVITSAGITTILSKTRFRSAVMLGVLGVLFVNSAFAVGFRDLSPERDREEDSYLREFAPVIDRDASLKLIILNTIQRRYLFPFVHALHSPAAVHFVRDNMKVSIPVQALSPYDRIYLVNLYVDYDTEAFLTDNEIHNLSELLASQHYELESVLTAGEGPKVNSLRVFHKVSKPITDSQTVPGLSIRFPLIKHGQAQ